MHKRILSIVPFAALFVLAHHAGAVPQSPQTQKSATHKPFGTYPVYLTIGNHEMVPPKTRPEYISEFRNWIDRPDLRAQRLRDEPRGVEPKIYYHWIARGIDFIAQVDEDVAVDILEADGESVSVNVMREVMKDEVAIAVRKSDL